MTSENRPVVKIDQIPGSLVNPQSFNESSSKSAKKIGENWRKPKQDRGKIQENLIESKDSTSEGITETATPQHKKNTRPIQANLSHWQTQLAAKCGNSKRAENRLLPRLVVREIFYCKFLCLLCELL